jgi:O-antigen biosynthesis protein
VARHPEVKAIRQAPAGLSVARNTGAAAASGEILAYTDDDCVVDPHWLHYLAVAFRDAAVAAAGGPNIAPAPISQDQACVIAAPGGPAHVLLGDSVAEHVPGCNLAVRKAVFESVGGFLPRYHAAGDDVDFCWRLLARGFQISFHAGAMVWHYRRFALQAYLKQQQGYGKAEGLLLGQYGNRFGHFSGAQWKGVVYQSALASIARRRGRIYSGPFGHASYQLVYAAPLSIWGAVVSSVPWLFASLGLLLAGTVSSTCLWLGILLFLGTLLWPVRQALELPIPAAERFGGPLARAKLYFLLLLGPVLRSLSRFSWGLRSGGMPTAPWPRLAASKPKENRRFRLRSGPLKFWSSTGVDRLQLLPALERELASQGWEVASDDGWRHWDLEFPATLAWRARIATVTEYHGGLKCLTRVRLELPPRLWLVVVTSGLLAASIWCFWLENTLAASFFPALLFALTAFSLTKRRMVRRELTAAAQAAAEQCQLSPATTPRGQTPAE